jgi:hypothetical protein
MVTAYRQKYPVISIPKINYKSLKLHPLARFVTEETIGLMFNLKEEEIYRIDCWQYVVYLHGKGISTFISYADFPPFIGVSQPQKADISLWKQRWRRKSKSKYAPPFWTEFYLHKLPTILSATNLGEWENLLSHLKPVLSDLALQKLSRKMMMKI